MDLIDIAKSITDQEIKDRLHLILIEIASAIGSVKVKPCSDNYFAAQMNIFGRNYCLSEPYTFTVPFSHKTKCSVYTYRKIRNGEEWA